MGGHIDPVAFAARRMMLHLSQRELGRRLGVSSPVIKGIEEGRSEQMTLARASRACREIGLTLASVLVEDHDGPPSLPATESGDDAARSDYTSVEPEDPSRVEAVLFSARRPLHVATLEQILEWPRPRLLTGLECLGRAAAGRGVVVLRKGATVTLVPSESISPSLIASAERRVLTEIEVTLHGATILREIARYSDQGVKRPKSAQGNAGRVTLGRLLNAGLVIRERAGHHRLSDEVRCSIVDALPNAEWRSRSIGGLRGHVPVITQGSSRRGGRRKLPS